MSSSLSFDVPTALEYFESLVADDASLPLLEAAVAIAQDEYPQLDVQAVLAELDGLGERLRSRLPADAPASYRLRALNRYFHDELGFAGNVNNYYEPGNSYVHRVLLTRRGIPITLAVIYLELAAHVGLQARGVAFPGHFLIKLHLAQGEVVLDPFSGRSLSREALEEALLPYRRSSGPDGGAKSQEAEIPLEFYLQAATPRQVLARMLRNLKEIHRDAEDWPRLLAVQQRLVVLLPGDAAERRDRGLVLEALGHWRAAADDLDYYLAHGAATAAGSHVLSDREELRQRRDVLRSRGGPSLH